MTRDEPADSTSPPGTDEAAGPADPTIEAAQSRDAPAGETPEESGGRARAEAAGRRRSAPGASESEAGPGRASAAGLHPPPEASRSEHWSWTIRRRVAEGVPDEEPGDGAASPAAGASAALTAEIRERVERRLKETEERRSAQAAAPDRAGTPAAAGPARDRSAGPGTPQPPRESAGVPAWSAGWIEDEETAPRAGASPAKSPSRLAAFIATCAYLGRIRLAPGTLGAAAGLLVFAVTRGLPGTISLGLFAVAVLVGTWAAARHAKDLRHPDPPSVVVDEFCGMWLALLGTDPSLMAAGIAFVAFRFLDIAKPPPIRQLERLPRGLGIMADDLMAGGIVRAGVLLILGM